MNLQFTGNESDYRKVLVIKRLIALVDAYDLQKHLDPDALSELRQEVERFLAQPEFRERDDNDVDDIIESRPGGLRDFLRKMLGPGRQEINLSKQRESLIERAEHAEASAFEALAELTEAARERDDLKARLKELETELTELKSEVQAGQ